MSRDCVYGFSFNMRPDYSVLCMHMRPDCLVCFGLSPDRRQATEARGFYVAVVAPFHIHPFLFRSSHYCTSVEIVAVADPDVGAPCTVKMNWRQRRSCVAVRPKASFQLPCRLLSQSPVSAPLSRILSPPSRPSRPRVDRNTVEKHQLQDGRGAGHRGGRERQD